MTNICPDCGKDHGDQRLTYPIGTIVEAKVRIHYPLVRQGTGMIECGERGRVLFHTQDGRASIQFMDHPGTHTFHHPESVLKICKTISGADPLLEGTETEDLADAKAALKILMQANPMHNDRDAYLYEVARWGLGEIDNAPDPVAFGVV